MILIHLTFAFSFILEQFKFGIIRNLVTIMLHNNKHKKCILCEENIDFVDYKDTEFLRRFLSPYSKILPRKKTGTCAKHQRILARELKRARFMALIPYVNR